MSSRWDGGEVISVQIGDGTPGTYTVNTNGTATAITPAYWQSTAVGQAITAWYASPERDGTVSLFDQSAKLAYVLYANTTADFNQSVSLPFTHQLAKVRVNVSGMQANQVFEVKLYSYITCTHTQGTISTNGAAEDWITMRKTTYDTGTCWEANVVPDHTITRLMVNDIEVTLDGNGITPVGAALNIIDLTVGDPVIDLTADNCTNISGEGNYRVRGTFNHQITITGGSPTLYLEDAQISVSGGNAIDITGGNPTIHIKGKNNSVSSADNTGIAVSGGATVTIKGNSTADVLTAKGNNGGAGIGSPLNGTVGGNISINNVTVNATGGSGSIHFGGAGIGSSGNGTCGDITITDAVIVATGGDYSPGIGMGYGNTTQPSIGKITITNSNVTSKAGYYASAIGLPYTEGATGAMPDYKAGQIIITTDNLETFLSKLTAGGTANLYFATYAQRIGVGSHANMSSPSILNQDGSGPWEGVVINGTVYADGYE